MSVISILISQTQRFLDGGEPIHPAIREAAQQVVNSEKS